MTNISKCPKCEVILSHVLVEFFDGKVVTTSQIMKSAAYSCPYCHTVISVDTNPYALVEEIVKRLKTK